MVAAVLPALIGCPEVRPPTPKPAPAPTTSAVATASATVPDPEPTEIAPIPGQRVVIEDKAMGTRVVLAAYTTETIGRVAVRKALDAALAEIRRIESVMSTWIPTSDVSKINNEAGSKPVSVSEETFNVIAKSLWISKLSEGTFDITFASMGALWSFDENLSTRVPDPKEVEKARKKIDYTKVKLDATETTVMLQDADTRINLGGIAKGYAIDRASALLRERGLTSFYCQAGGDLFVEGKKPDGTPWRVGIRDPRGPEGKYFAILDVEDHAFSTAGDYERFFLTKDGKRYHHILDPRTGYPATASRSVTIWAKDAVTADAIDNAVFILGPEKGLALVESLDETGAVIVDANNKVHVSKRLKGRVKILRPPTDGP
jgi:thiamine biosynthesis lipoprotein